MIKLIVSDMDGTLLDSRSNISSKNLNALKYANKKGVDFVIATGREFNGLREIISKYNLNVSYTILGNGAQFADGQGNVLSHSYLDKNLYTPITEILDKLNIPFIVFTTNGIYANDVYNVRDTFVDKCNFQFNIPSSDYTPDGKIQDAPIKILNPINDTTSFLNSDLEIIKVEAFSLDIPIIDKAKRELSLIPELSSLSSFKDNIEITANQAQKGNILSKCIEKLGISRDEVMVIGDGLNDISMFKLFKYSFAPSNADEIIRELAYDVVCDHNQGAVSEAIYKMI